MCDPDLDVFQNDFYSLSKQYTESVIEKDPLEAVKVCTLHAIYNVMDKATVALAYIGT